MQICVSLGVYISKKMLIAFSPRNMVINKTKQNKIIDVPGDEDEDVDTVGFDCYKLLPETAAEDEPPQAI